MNARIILIILLSTSNLFAQDVLIPYREGDRWGLCDLSGKVLLKPVYDNVEYLSKGYFSYWNYKDPADKQRRSSRESPAIVSGVLHGVKPVISGQPFERYQIHGRFIIGGSNVFGERGTSLFTIEGKKILDELVRSFEFFDSSGASSKYKGHTRFVSILLSYPDKSVSFCVYDVDKQAVTQWLLKHVRQFSIRRDESNRKMIVCNYTDSNSYYQEKRIAYNPNSKRYELSDIQKLMPVDEERETMMGSPDGPDDYDDVAPAMEPMEEVPPSNAVTLPKKTSTILPKKLVDPKEIFKTKNDEVVNERVNKSFKYISDKEILFGDEPFEAIPGASYHFFSRYYQNTQDRPLIYKVDGRAGLIRNDGTYTQAIYDTLAYINKSSEMYTRFPGALYYAGFKDPASSQFKFGIIDGNEKVVIPIEYDSLFTHLPELKVDWDRQANKMYYKFDRGHYSPRDAPTQLNPDELLLAYRYGKYGLITFQDKPVLAFEYDAIYRNGINYFRQAIETDFIILVKNGKYGLLERNYRKENVLFIEPVFPFKPTYYYRHYYNVKGLRLFGLSNESSLHFCFANANGVVYYKK